MRRIALLALALLLMLTGCGGTSGTATPAADSSSPSGSATTDDTAAADDTDESAAAEPSEPPSEVPTRAPRAPRRLDDSDRSAARFARYAVTTFYYAIAARDFAPMRAITGPVKDCRGCKDTGRLIADLEEKGQYQVPGRARFRTVDVTAREGARRVVKASVDLGRGTYVVEEDGTRGRVKAQRRVQVQLLLSWRPKAKTWVVLDYAIAGRR